MEEGGVQKAEGGEGGLEDKGKGAGKGTGREITPYYNEHKGVYIYRAQREKREGWSEGGERGVGEEGR